MCSHMSTPKIKQARELGLESELMMEQREKDEMSSQTSLPDASDTVEE